MFKKILIWLFCIYVAACSYQNTRAKGSTNFLHAKEASLTSNFTIEQRIVLYEGSNKSWGVISNNIIDVDYNHFGQEVKTNVFTTLGLEF